MGKLGVSQDLKSGRRKYFSGRGQMFLKKVVLNYLILHARIQGVFDVKKYVT